MVAMRCCGCPSRTRSIGFFEDFSNMGVQIVLSNSTFPQNARFCPFAPPRGALSLVPSSGSWRRSTARCPFVSLSLPPIPPNKNTNAGDPCKEKEKEREREKLSEYNVMYKIHWCFYWEGSWGKGTKGQCSTVERRQDPDEGTRDNAPRSGVKGLKRGFLGESGV